MLNKLLFEHKLEGKGWCIILDQEGLMCLYYDLNLPTPQQESLNKIMDLWSELEKELNHYESIS